MPADDPYPALSAGYVQPPDVWHPADLQSAVTLDLSGTVASANAVALVGDLARKVADHEQSSGTRGNQRRPSGQAKLLRAVGAIVDGLLRAWASSTPRATFRRTEPAAFTGAPIGHRQFTAAMGGLAALGYVSSAKGIRFAYQWDDGGKSSHGFTARFRPTLLLLNEAASCGVTPATVRQDFRPDYPDTAPVVSAPVVLRTLPERTRRKGQGQRLPKDVLPILADDVDAQRIARQVQDANARAARHDVRGCLPPRWHRPFVLGWTLGGRWTAMGTDGLYQTMPKAERARITIDGQRTAELDVRASQLTILYGLLGVPMPDHADPYGFGGLPRDAVKAWITATLGKGSPVRRWSAAADADVKAVPVEVVSAAVLARYPALADPARVARDLANLGPPRKLLTHRLMGVEARAVTTAMERLWAADVLPLPIHDGLIVPADHANIATNALRSGYAEACGAVAQVVRSGP